MANGMWSVRMADSVMRRNVPFRWHYEHGLALLAIEQVWRVTRDVKYWDYIRNCIDLFVDASGDIKTYTIDEYNLDQINPGKILFPLYRATGEERYKRAAFLLREQLRGQPRTREHGFWHKQIYPYQMWLDGIYMASPFLAEFAKTFPHTPPSQTGEGKGGGAFDDIAHQIILIEQHTRDQKTGLLYHGWDESKQQRWANLATGCSPHFWGRAMGWYAMAIVDVLDYLPTDHAQRPAILAIFERMIDAVAQAQDQPTGLWYQVLDNPSPSVIASREAEKQSPTSVSGIASQRSLATLAPHASAGVTQQGNYLEASASCMFVYAIAKAVRKNYLAAGYLGIAQKAYRGILGNLIEIDERGLVNLNGTCGGAGLGGTPYRDGSYEYYVGEKIIVNDYKGVGPFILASIEIESL